MGDDVRRNRGGNRLVVWLGGCVLVLVLLYVLGYGVVRWRYGMTLVTTGSPGGERWLMFREGDRLGELLEWVYRPMLSIDREVTGLTWFVFPG